MESLGDKLKNLLLKLADTMSGSSGQLAAKLELNRLKQELEERERLLGRKVAKLHNSGLVKDRFLLEALREELVELGGCEEEIEKNIARIQDSILADSGVNVSSENDRDEKGNTSA